MRGKVSAASARGTACALLAGLFVSMPAFGAGAADDIRNYRRLIADALVLAMKTLPPGAFQAGPLRVARAPQPGDYAVCLQTVSEGRTDYFAAFIAAGAVASIRRAIGIDRCWLETEYAALPRSAVKPKADAPPPTRKPRRSLGKR